MTLFDIGFYGLVVGILGTSFLFLSLKNPIRILLSFSLLVMQIAALMMLLEAVFVALLFLVFYTALISVFLVFYMVTQNHSTAKVPPLSSGYKWLTFLITAGLALQTFFILVYKVRHLFKEAPQNLGNLEASPRVLGELIYNDYPLFIVCLGLLFFSIFIGIILIMGTKKSKLLKPSSMEKVQRDLNSIELRDLKFSNSSEAEQNQK
jgi:NADH:ubiquinone oxidoreductase subunit 6 (subunit J)